MQNFVCVLLSAEVVNLAVTSNFTVAIKNCFIDFQVTITGNATIF